MYFVAVIMSEIDVQSLLTPRNTNNKRRKLLSSLKQYGLFNHFSLSYSSLLLLYIYSSECIFKKGPLKLILVWLLALVITRLVVWLVCVLEYS